MTSSNWFTIEDVERSARSDLGGLRCMPCVKHHQGDAAEACRSALCGCYCNTNRHEHVCPTCLASVLCDDPACVVEAIDDHLGIRRRRAVEPAKDCACELGAIVLAPDDACPGCEARS